MKIKIWGARGSIPSPLPPQAISDKIYEALLGASNVNLANPDAVRAYVDQLNPLLGGTAGGNTACVEVMSGNKTFIIDGGSGLRQLGLELMKGPCGRGEGELHLLFSHTHWDHIQGFPFFRPAFIPGNKIFIYSVHDLSESLTQQQRTVNFPVPLSYMQADMVFTPITPAESLSFGPTTIKILKTNHPGDAYAFRFEDEHSIFVYASDAEYKQFDEASLRPTLNFFHNADVLIFDAQFTLKEAWEKEDWGHSSALIGVDLARRANVKRLVLFHHDPTYTDQALLKIQSDSLEYQKQDLSRPSCDVIVAYEGLEFDLTPPGVVSAQRIMDGETVVIRPNGTFDEIVVERLQQHLAHLDETGWPSHLVINLERVKAITIAGLRSVISLRREKEGTTIILANAASSVRRVIELTGFTGFFAIYPTVEEALTAIRAQEASNLPGQVFKNRYRIENKIGDGRLGSVFKATDLEQRNYVAIKILSASFSEMAINQFLRQARQIVEMSHPNIVKTLACDSDHGLSFSVEELIEGDTLQMRIAAQATAAFAPEKIIRIGLAVASALEHAHSRGVIHGDLTPDNIFLTDNSLNAIKVSDFGLGRLEEGRQLLDSTSILLTPHYLAPEQVLGHALDARADLYALGAILYQLSTGHHLFEGSEQAVMHAHLHQQPESPRLKNPSLSRPLEHLILKLLAKTPNERYTTAQQVRRILTNLATTETAENPIINLSEVGQRHFVGRTKELQKLIALWEETYVGQGQLVFITGEVGSGKSRLTQELANHVHDATVLIGQCQPLEGSSTYQPFHELLRTYFATVPPSIGDKNAQQLLSDIAQIVPELRQILPDLPRSPRLEPQQAQMRLRNSVARFIEQANQNHPWVMILEDLHWADSNSLQLLNLLAQNLHRIPMLIIGTYHEAELQNNRRLQESLTALGRHPGYKHINLGRLNRGDIQGMLFDIWDETVPPNLINRIFECTGGNPFYVEEVAKGLMDEGLVRNREGQWEFSPLTEVKLPQSVRDAVMRRVSHLNKSTRTLLSQAAVLGQSFRFDDLRELSKLTEWEVLEYLDLALERQLIKEAADETVLRFSHAEIRQVLYEDLSILRRRMLHRQAALTLEKRYQPTPERYAEELAYHFAQAGMGDEALAYTITATQQAYDAQSIEAAHRLGLRAMEILQKIDPSGTNSRYYARRQQIHQQMGRILDALGQFPDALSEYLQARRWMQKMDPSPERERESAWLCRNIASLYHKQGEHEQAFHYLKEGLTHIDDQSASLEEAHIYLLGAQAYMMQGKNREALDWAEKSRQIATQYDSEDGQAVLGRTYLHLGRIYERLGDLETAKDFSLKALQAYEKFGDRVGQARVYGTLGTTYAELDQWETGLKYLNKSLKLVGQTGYIYYRGVFLNNIANIYITQGQWNKAQQSYEECRAIARQIGAALLEAVALSNLAEVAMHQADWVRAKTCLNQSQKLYKQVDTAMYLPEQERRWAEYYLGLGQPETALTHIQKSIELIGDAQNNALELGQSYRVLGLVQLAREEFEAAETVLQESQALLKTLGGQYQLSKTKLQQLRLESLRSPEPDLPSRLKELSNKFREWGAQSDLEAAETLLTNLEEN